MRKPSPDLLGLVADAERMMSRIEPEPDHVLQVRNLAVQLFGELRAFLELPPDHLPLLEAAALLHDIGWSVSGRGHHKHSAKIILEEGLPSATDREVLIVAAIARAHRKSPPIEQHDPYRRLDEDDQRLTLKLASILRVADGLDRSHCAVVSKVKARTDDQERLILELHATRQPDVELYGLAKKKSLLEDLLGMQVRAEIRDV